MISPNQNRLIKQFVELVQIDSPSFEEARFVSALTGELMNLGLAVENDRSGENGAGNLLAVFPARQGNSNHRPGHGRPGLPQHSGVHHRGGAGEAGAVARGPGCRSGKE